MRALLFFFSCLVFLAGCSSMFLDAEEAVGKGLQSKGLSQLKADSLDDYGAPFLLDTAYIQGTKLWIEVSFSGGCQEHDFILAWPEATTMMQSAEIGLTLYHKNSTDHCQAKIREVLKVELRNTPLGDFKPENILAMRFNVVNGSQPERSISTH